MSTVAERKISRFKRRVGYWARKLRVQPVQIRVQTMSRKWASCSNAGWVSFSTDLLAQPKSFREYVIVHELLHLKVPNHGKLFRGFLRAYLSDGQSHFPAASRVGLEAQDPGVAEEKRR